MRIIRCLLYGICVVSAVVYMSRGRYDVVNAFLTGAIGVKLFLGKVRSDES